MNLVENVTKVSIIAKNGADEQKEYELYIVKEETNEDEDVSLKEVNADGKLANLNADGVYEVNVKATQTKVDLKAIATQELALVSVDGNENTRGSNTKQIDLSTVTTKEITITVTSISGIQKQYTVKIHRQSAITGKVITQAKDQNNQSAQIIVYNSKDTRKEDDKEDPRKIIQDIIINKDGTFSIDLEPDEYDIVIKKTSYLEYRLTNIVVNEWGNITIADINIYAGDIVKQ